MFEGEAGQPVAPVLFKVVEHASPADAALEESRHGYDLVLVGVGQEWGLEQRPFGIQSEHLIRECPTSLLVIRHFTPEGAREAVAQRGAAREPTQSSAALLNG